MEAERIQTRKEILEVGLELADVHDRIMTAIHRTESEKQALKALRKFKIHLETFERQQFHLGRLN